MFMSINKKNNVYPYKPQFYYIKVGFKGVKIILACFHDGRLKFGTERVKGNGNIFRRGISVKIVIPYFGTGACSKSKPFAP